MRVLQLSDLHLDVNAYLTGLGVDELIGDLKSYLKLVEKDFDVLMIAGDVSNSMGTSLNIVREIEDYIGKKVLFVPGNHDVSRNHYLKIGSDVVYSIYKESEYNLYDNPFQLKDGFYVVGSLGWYDYSFNLDYNNIPYGAIDKIRKEKKQMFYDGKEVNFKKRDVDFFNKELEVLESTFEKLEGNDIWFLNHFIPYEDYIVTKEDNELWNKSNSYMGSRFLGDKLDEFSNIKYVSFGHTHKRFGLQERGGKNIICNPLGYYHEWETGSLLEELKLCGVFIDIG